MDGERGVMSWTCAYCQASSGPAGNVEDTKRLISDWVVYHLGNNFHRECLGKSLRIQRESFGVSLETMSEVLGINTFLLNTAESGSFAIGKAMSKAYADELIRLSMLKNQKGGD